LQLDRTSWFPHAPVTANNRLWIWRWCVPVEPLRLGPAQLLSYIAALLLPFSAQQWISFGKWW
jgi:hypothetical protein